MATLACHAAAKAKLRVVILQRERGGECRQVEGGGLVDGQHRQAGRSWLQVSLASIVQTHASPIT